VGLWDFPESEYTLEGDEVDRVPLKKDDHEGRDIDCYLVLSVKNDAVGHPKRSDLEEEEGDLDRLEKVELQIDAHTRH